MEDMRLGGPQKQLIYFLNQIKDYQDLKKYYLILPTGSKKILSKFIKISKFNIEEVNFQYLSKKYILRYLLNFLKESIILKKKLTDFSKVYLPGGTSNLKSLLISVLLKKKIFFHIHDTRLNKISKLIIFLISKRIKCVFFASKKSEIYYKKVFKNNKKYILKSSVLPLRYKIKKKISSNFNIGIVANINPDKNIELLIDVIKKTKSKKIKFHLIGNLWDTQKKYYKYNLNSFKDVKGKMKWYRNVYFPEKIMRKFDVLICTSKYESLPLSIIEALNLGIPVISNNVGDVKNVINNKKFKCGFIVNDQKPENFIFQINHYMRNKSLLKKHSINANMNVKENFSILDFSSKINKYISN